MFSSPNEKRTESVNVDRDEDEIDTTSEAKQNEEQKTTLVACDPASERNILKTSEVHKMMSAEELFSKLDNDLKIEADGSVDRFQSCELFWQDQGDVFADDQLSVERISAHDTMKTKDKPIMTDIGQI